jgi:flagellar hook-length control protein FliK
LAPGRPSVRERGGASPFASLLDIGSTNSAAPRERPDPPANASRQPACSSDPTPAGRPTDEAGQTVNAANETPAPRDSAPCTGTGPDDESPQQSTATGQDDETAAKAEAADVTALVAQPTEAPVQQPVACAIPDVTPATPQPPANPTATGESNMPAQSVEIAAAATVTTVAPADASTTVNASAAANANAGAATIAAGETEDQNGQPAAPPAPRPAAKAAIAAKSASGTGEAKPQDGTPAPANADDKPAPAHLHVAPQEAHPHEHGKAPHAHADLQAIAASDAANLSADNNVLQPATLPPGHLNAATATTAPAATAQTAPAPTADTAVPIAGLAVEIAAKAQSGKNRFEIRLDPPDLGRIDVRLDVDRGGTVTSRLVVEKAETLDLLRRDAPELERALQQAGLKTGDNGLQFSLRDQSFAGRDDGRQPQATARVVVPDADLTAVETAQSYGRMLRQSGGIDIHV